MWLYEGKEFTEVPDGIVGFVYKITNTLDKREYIGKKLFSFVRSKPVKGKTRRKRTVFESDWREYYGSNKELCDDVGTHGERHFIREILHLCESKGLCNYHEARLQFLLGVLEQPEKFYNQQIRCRVHRSHLKLKK
jgi:Putative endonuclease segE, GIY-YIG domain